MTKLAFVADVHLDNHQKWGGPVKAGLNSRAHDTLAALCLAMETAEAAGAEQFIVAGDLFHRSNPSPQMMTEVLSTMTDYRMPVTILVGNHDKAGADEADHALGPLAFHTDGFVVDAPYIEQMDGGKSSVIVVPFTPGDPAVWLPEAIKKLRGTAAPSYAQVTTTLVAHFGISDKGTPYYLDQSTGAINVSKLEKICKRFGITDVFAGDWHRHQRWAGDGVRICQIGALAPARFPPNYEHGDRGPLVVFDTMTGKSEIFDIAGPRFYKFRWGHNLPEDWKPPKEAMPAYLKVVHRPQQTEEVNEWIEALKVECALQSRSGLAGVELEADRGEERAKARTASFEARKASSLDEALARYVQRMPVEQGVERETVLSHVRRLMA